MGLSEEIVAVLEEFLAEDLARMGGGYLVGYMDDSQRRVALGRAAKLAAGLRSDGCGERDKQLLIAMCYIERTVRQHSFAFIASLPDEIKDYLMKLKNAAAA